MEPTTVRDQWSIPDDLWEGLVNLIPPRVNTHPFGGGKPPTPDRVCMEAILYVLRTGCQWKALDATRFCPGSTAHDRFQLWVRQGVFQKMWECGLLAYDDWKGIDWSWLSLDGCMTKAPLGGEKTGKNPTDRAKKGVKRSLLAQVAHFEENICHFLGFRRGDDAKFPENSVVESAQITPVAM